MYAGIVKRIGSDAIAPGSAKDIQPGQLAFHAPQLSIQLLYVYQFSK